MEDKVKKLIKDLSTELNKTESELVIEALENYYNKECYKLYREYYNANNS